MELKEKLFDVLNEYTSKVREDGNLTKEKVMEIIMDVNKFNADFLDEAIEFLGE